MKHSYAISDRLQRQIDFILEADKSKFVGRQTYLTDGKRKENDAEHSWHLALMAVVLSEYAPEEINIQRVMTMVLIHDIIEIDAGDTYAYDTEGNKTKRGREIKAADRIFNILPKDQAEYIRDIWEEFEAAQTNEALFALALDKVQPILLNDASGGRAWREHDVFVDQVIKRNHLTPLGAEKLWEYCMMLLDRNVVLGNLKEK
ncbi:MAG: HD domain-containing protein [Eubacterium sp.]